MLKSTVILILYVNLCYCAKLPYFFTKCKASDPEINKCLLANIEKGYDELAKGHDKYHIPKFDPLNIPSLYIEASGGLIINLTDVTFTGLNDVIVEKASIDTDKKEMQFKFKIPTQFNVMSHYSIQGRILILPIQGDGPLNVTYINPYFTFDLKYDVEKIGNKDYLVPKSNKLVYTITRIYFDLQNLFNGDKRLGEEMSKFLNENWKEVNDEIGQRLGEALGNIIQKVLTNFFRKVPYNEAFDE